MKEGTDYELMLHEENDEHWSCRILTGAFPETVIKFASIQVDEGKDQLGFNFHVLSSPDPEAHIDNVDLQQVAAACLSSVFDACVEEGTAKFTDTSTGKEIEAHEIDGYEKGKK